MISINGQGSFWSKQAQVDVLAINWRTKDILLGECKWEKEAVGRKVIHTLFDKTEKVLPKSVKWTVHYAFFSRNGFTQPAQDEAQSEGAMLVALPQIEVDIRRWMALYER